MKKWKFIFSRIIYVSISTSQLHVLYNHEMMAVFNFFSYLTIIAAISFCSCVYRNVSIETDAAEKKAS